MAAMDDLQALRTLFMKVQESATAHKLSDRNCIEIINKLTSLGLLEVIYTTDGREYLTSQQIEREIRDEVIVNGGDYFLALLVCTDKLLVSCNSIEPEGYIVRPGDGIILYILASIISNI